MLHSKLLVPGLLVQNEAGSSAAGLKGVESELPDFNSGDCRLVRRALCESYDDLAAGVGGGRELLDQSRVPANIGVDVEVAKHRGAVDGYVEHAFPEALK